MSRAIIGPIMALGLCVLLSAVVGLLVSYQTLADHYSLRAGLCCDMVHGHSYDLFHD